MKEFGMAIINTIVFSTLDAKIIRIFGTFQTKSKKSPLEQAKIVYKIPFLRIISAP